MRILQVAPLAERVPPPAYGGTEAIVGLLADGLVRRGHDVVLRASGDSITIARLRSVYPRSLRTAIGIENTIPYELVHAAEALRDASDFDKAHPQHRRYGGKTVADTARHMNGHRGSASAAHIIGFPSKAGIETLLDGFRYNLDAEGKSPTTIDSYAQAIRRFVKTVNLPTDVDQITKGSR